MGERFVLDFFGEKQAFEMDPDSMPTTTKAPDVFAIEGSWPTWYFERPDVGSGKRGRLLRSVDPVDPTRPYSVARALSAQSSSDYWVLFVDEVTGYLYRRTLGSILLRTMMEPAEREAYDEAHRQEVRRRYG